MSYVNVGALDRDGKRFKSKAAMKEAVKAQLELEAKSLPLADLVAFDQTAMVHSGSVPGVATVEDIPEGVVLSVVGPDPYNDRRWYANVERKGDKVVVK